MTNPSPAPAPAGPAHPWRRVLRTILANLGAFAVTLPIIINAMGIDPNEYPQIWAIMAGIIAVSAAVTRILAIPAVEVWLQKTIKFLAANDVAVDQVAAVKQGDVLVAGPAAIYPNGEEVAVTPIPANTRDEDAPRRAADDPADDI